MNGYVVGFNPTKKIQAIKGIRSVTRLSLKDAKDVADRVEAGTKTKITFDAPDGVAILEEHGVTFDPIPVFVRAADFVEVLSRYPRDRTVGELVDVLRVAADLAEVAS